MDLLQNTKKPMSMPTVSSSLAERLMSLLLKKMGLIQPFVTCLKKGCLFFTAVTAEPELKLAHSSWGCKILAKGR